MIGKRAGLPFIRSVLIVWGLLLQQGCSGGLNSDLVENPASLAVKIVDTEPTQGCTYVGEVLSLSQHLTRHFDPLGVAEVSKKEQAKHLRSYAAGKGANVVVVVHNNYADPQLKLQANTLYRC